MLVQIQGSLSSGKSSLLELAAANGKFAKVLQEPVLKWVGKELWHDISHNFLGEYNKTGDTIDFYRLTTQIGRAESFFSIFRLQMCVAETLAERDERALTEVNGWILAERSVQSGSLFVDASTHSMLDKEIMRKYIDAKVKQIYKEEVIVIYLDTEVKEAMRRIKLRNREAESQITFDYLAKLKALHDEAYEREFAPIPIKRITKIDTTYLTKEEVYEKFELFLAGMSL